MIFSILWVRHIIIGPKSSKWSESIIPITHLYQKKAQIEQNAIIVFIESWKEIRLWFWFIWIAKWLFLNYLQGVNWDQSWTKNWNFVYIPCLFIRVFQNALNSICKTMRTTCGQNFSSIWSCLLELLLPNRSKWLQLGLKPKILSASSRYSQEQKVHKNWNLVSRTFRRMFLL